MPKRSPTSAPTTLRDIGESGLIRGIAEWARRSPGASGSSRAAPWARMEVLVGIGDDTAIIRPTPGSPPMALTTDMLVEGVHFLPDHPPARLGAKALVASLSDLAAVGARPAWFLVSLAAPARTPASWVEEVYRGMQSAAEPFGGLCLGGDTARGPQRTLSIVAGGNCDPASSLPLRSRAEAGQDVYVTGSLGDSACGLSLLKEHARLLSAPTDDLEWIVERHQRPAARVEAGIAIARHCPDAAMMDLSDGLVADLPRMAEASQCGFEVRLSRLPVSTPLRRVAAKLSKEPGDFALAGGEDYELLFTTALPPEKWKHRVARAASGRPLRVTRIGAVTTERDVRYLDAKGRALDSGAGAFDHF